MSLARYSETAFSASPCPRASAACLLMMDLWMSGVIPTAARDRLAAKVGRIRRTRDAATVEEFVGEVKRWAAGTDFAAAPVLA